ASPIDWSTLQSTLRPPGLTDAEWNPLFAQIQTQIGNEWPEFVAAISADATLLPPSLGINYSPRDVFALEAHKAQSTLSPSVSGRLFVNDTSHVLSNAAITLFDSSQNTAAGTSSLTDGSFLLPQIPPGTYQVRLDGYVSAAPLIVTIGSSSVS